LTNNTPSSHRLHAGVNRLHGLPPLPELETSSNEEDSNISNAYGGGGGGDDGTYSSGDEDFDHQYHPIIKMKKRDARVEIDFNNIIVSRFP
jgi:hypothetical protein